MRRFNRENRASSGLGRMLRVGAVSSVLMSGAVIGFGGVASASPSNTVDGTTTWVGNGTTNGACSSFQNDITPPAPPGEQAWLFILTQSTAPSALNATFQNAGAVTVQSAVIHGGSTHFVVWTPANDTLVSATATTGSSGSVLTVSHCWITPVVDGPMFNPLVGGATLAVIIALGGGVVLFRRRRMSDAS